MPTYTWTRTRGEVRDMVLRKLGVLGVGGVAAPDDAAVVNEAIDARLKSMHGLGLLWWQIAPAQSSVTVTAGVNPTSLSALTDFLFPVSVAIRVGSEDVDLDIIGHAEYQAIPDKTQGGQAQMAYFNGSMYLWPVPSANASVKLTYQAIAADGENAALDIPVGMIRPFVDVVTGDLVDEFGVDQVKAGRLLAKQERAIREIRALNQERVTATDVVPDWF